MSDDEERGSEKSPETDKTEESPEPKKTAASDSKADKHATTRREKRAPVRRRVAPKHAVAADAAADPADDVVAPKALGGAVRVAEERSARRFLSVGVTLAVAGLALVGTGPSEAGMALSLAGLLTLIYGIHTFGRLGPVPAK